MQELFSSPYQIFTASVLFVFSLALIEVVLFLIGSSTSSLFDDADMDVDLDLDADIDVDFDLDVTPDGADLFEFDANSVIAPSSFFHVGKVPFFVIILCIGMTFGCFGIFIHKLAASMGIDLSTLISIPLSIGFSALSTWGITSALSSILPGEENYAIEESSFIAREATVEDGVGSSNLGVMVSFVDEHGVTHRLLGTVPIDGLTVSAGDKVVILNKNYEKGGFFILPSFDALAEKRKELEKNETLKEMVMTM